MNHQELVIATRQKSPDNVSTKQTAGQAEFIADVQRGLRELDRGEFVTHEKVKMELAAWTAK